MDTHYVRITVSFLSSKESGIRQVLLALTPVDDETSFSTAQHKDLIEFVLSVIKRSLNKVVTIVADNLSVKRSPAVCLGTGYIWFLQP